MSYILPLPGTPRKDSRMVLAFQLVKDRLCMDHRNAEDSYICNVLDTLVVKGEVSKECRQRIKLVFDSRLGDGTFWEYLLSQRDGTVPDDLNDIAFVQGKRQEWLDSLIKEFS